MSYRLDPAEFFVILADDLRRRILMLLLAQRSLCVCELFYSLEVAQPKVSRHLALMRAAGVVSQRKYGKWVIYQLHHEMPLWASHIVQEMAAALRSELICIDDAMRLAGMPNRPDKAGICAIPVARLAP